MSSLSKVLFPVAAAILISGGTATVSFANSSSMGENSSEKVHTRNSTINSDSGRFTSKHVLDGSSTATHYYLAGVSQFEKGQYEKAELSFKAVLRAKGLNQQAHYYLAKTYMALGDRETAAKHALKLSAYK